MEAKNALQHRQLPVPPRWRPVVHFGLGEATSVDQVEIRWPDGRSTPLENPEVDRYHTVPSDGGS